MEWSILIHEVTIVPWMLHGCLSSMDAALRHWNLSCGLMAVRRPSHGAQCWWDV